MAASVPVFLVLQLKNMATTPKSQHNELKPQDLQHNYIPCNKYGNIEFLATQVLVCNIFLFPSLSVRLSVCLSIACNSKHIPRSLSLSVCLLLATQNVATHSIFLYSNSIQNLSLSLSPSPLQLNKLQHFECPATQKAYWQHCNTF